MAADQCSTELLSRWTELEKGAQPAVLSVSSLSSWPDTIRRAHAISSKTFASKSRDDHPPDASHHRSAFIVPRFDTRQRKICKTPRPNRRVSAPYVGRTMPENKRRDLCFWPATLCRSGFDCVPHHSSHRSVPAARCRTIGNRWRRVAVERMQQTDALGDRLLSGTQPSYMLTAASAAQILPAARRLRKPSWCVMMSSSVPITGIRRPLPLDPRLGSHRSPTSSSTW